MLYQNLLTGPKPYHIGVSRHAVFPLHRHPDIELLYCISGSYPVCVNQQNYTLQAGDLCIVGSMVSHGLLQNPKSGLSLTIEIGPVLLGEYFRVLAESTFEPVYTLAPDSLLRKLLEETAEIRREPNKFADLHLVGNLYRIGAILCEQYQNPSDNAQDLKTIIKIEKALTLIYEHYQDNITVEDAAAISGYSKSNFCAAFKNVVGDSFHHVLNQHRVNSACYLLRDTAMSIGDVALCVGFPDSKSFCRAFKQFLQTSPGTYRKMSGHS